MLPMLGVFKQAIGKSMMDRYQWKHLSKQELGRFYEHFVQMELAMHGFEIYTPAVDDRGIDLVARHEGGAFIEIQVKSVRQLDYLFLRKQVFRPREHLYVALGYLEDGKAPTSLLIPSRAWENPAAYKECVDAFCEHEYEGRKSQPEYGLRLNAKRFSALEKYFAMHAVLAKLRKPASSSCLSTGEFLHEILRDDFLFSVDPGAYLNSIPRLSIDQRAVAMAVHGSDNYPSRTQEVMDLVESLHSIFRWQSNSEGPLIFAGKVLALLDFYQADAQWLVETWNSVASVR